jgi:hypothetical protein
MVTGAFAAYSMIQAARQILDLYSKTTTKKGQDHV